MLYFILMRGPLSFAQRMFPRCHVFFCSPLYDTLPTLGEINITYISLFIFKSLILYCRRWGPVCRRKREGSLSTSPRPQACVRRHCDTLLLQRSLSRLLFPMVLRRMVSPGRPLLSTLLRRSLRASPTLPSSPRSLHLFLSSQFCSVYLSLSR